MKKLALLLSLLTFVFTMSAQVEYVCDFNDFETGTSNMNGQHGWQTSHMYTAGSPDFDVDYVSDALMTPDESIGIWYVHSGSGIGHMATRKATPDFDFNFQNGGIIDIELDMHPSYWGTFFGVGYDVDGDGNILPWADNPIDGGVFLYARVADGTDKSRVYLPDGSYVAFDYTDNGTFNRYKMSFDFSAYNGQGSVTVFVKPGCQGEWIQQASCTNVNMHLNPGSGGIDDYQKWDGIFFYCSGSHGGFDNLVVRQQAEGNVQLIEMDDIPNQLVYNDPITLTASSTSGLPVSFELIDGPATLQDNVLSLTGETGIVKVKAYQPGDDLWLPAPDVFKTFEVVDPDQYEPEVTIRRPYEGTKVYMETLHPVMLVVSAYIEHPEVVKFTDVTCSIDGQEIALHTDYPDNPENGYFYNVWTPSAFGSYNMTVTITQSGGKTTVFNNSFEVTNQIENTMDIPTLHGDLVCTPSAQTVRGEYALPSHVGVFNNIMAHYDHNCVNGNCDAYDRVGGVRVRNYRGEWMELFRYITPFGKQCEDDLDITDYTSVLQGLVEFELYFETWSGSGYNPNLTFTYTKGSPEYLYADVKEIWSGIFSFGDYANQQPVPVVDYAFGDKAQAAKLKITTTGHNWSSGQNGTYNTGNAAEFYEATHHILINGENKYDQHLWRTCNPNPAGCSPQNGTWTYNRSGWCPGSIGLVWDFDLTDYVSNNSAELFYQFDPTYLDYCHPNHPDCIDGVTCTDCSAPDNPVLRVAGKVITYSNDEEMILSVNPIETEPSFTAKLYPNPAKNQLTINTDYEKGAVSVLIVNMQGQEVMYFTVEGQRTIDVSKLPAGIYTVKMLGGCVETQKLVIE